MDESYVSVLFTIVNEWGAIVNYWPKCLFGTQKEIIL